MIVPKFNKSVPNFSSNNFSVTDTQPKSDSKTTVEKTTVRTDLPFDQIAINQKLLASAFQYASNYASINESLNPFFEGGVEMLKRRLCSVAATLTCVNNLRTDWRPENGWDPWVQAGQIALTLLENHGIEISGAKIVPEDLEKTRGWDRWDAVSKNGTLYYHASASVAEGLGIHSLVVEGMPIENFVQYLKRGGSACISVDNSFVKHNSTTDQNLQPGGHILSVLGIKYDETTTDLLDEEVIIYDPYSDTKKAQTVNVSLRELADYIYKRSSAGVRGILFSKNLEELSPSRQYDSNGSAKSGKVIENIRSNLIHLVVAANVQKNGVVGRDGKINNADISGYPKSLQ